MSANAVAMAVRLIRQVEGCSLRPYPDTPPRWAIGFGFNFLPDGSVVTPETPDMTMDEIDAALAVMLDVVDQKVCGMVTVPMTDGMEAALDSFAWNEGISALRGSTLLWRLNAGDTAIAAGEFDKWIYAGGKVNTTLRDVRRPLEKSVFLGLVVP